jgi:hypothetical protein
MSIKPCPPCCAPSYQSIDVSDGFCSLTSAQQKAELETYLNQPAYYQPTVQALIDWIDGGHHIDC